MEIEKTENIEFEINDKELEQQLHMTTDKMTVQELLNFTEQLKAFNDETDEVTKTPCNFIAFLQREINDNFVEGHKKRSMLMAQWLKECVDEFFDVYTAIGSSNESCTA